MTSLYYSAKLLTVIEGHVLYPSHRNESPHGETGRNALGLEGRIHRVRLRVMARAQELGNVA